MSVAPSRVGLLDDRRRELLDVLLQQEGLEAATERIPRRPPGEDLPLTSAQERLWFLEQFQPASAVYNVPVLLPFSGPLDVGALARGLDDVAARHEVLRTTFALGADGPVQVVHPPFSLELTPVDCGGLPEAELRAEVQRRVSEETRLPFDLARGPLIRALLLRLGERQHLLLLTLHHIVCDAWSLDVLCHELGAFYRAHAAGEPAALPELPIQYGDFARWQRLRLRGEVLEGLLAYWRKQLAGVPDGLELPTDRPRPAVQTFRGDLRFFIVRPPDLYRQVRAFGQGEQATPFMVLLAAFQALLQRYTGQPDVVVGTPVASRDRRELEGLIGLFLNTLVLRADLSDDPSFRQLLAQARAVTLGAFAHQDLSFELLVSELRTHRNLNRTPLFQVLFVLQSTSQPAPVEGVAPPAEVVAPAAEREAPPAESNVPAAEREAPPAESSPAPGSFPMPQAATGTAKFDLSLFLNDTGRGLEGAWEFNTDLFDPATIARMSGHLATLLAAALAAPDRPLSELPLLTAPERQQLLEWNANQAPFAADLCPHQLFESQVAATPDAVAAIFAGSELSYDQLNRRANRLAHRLRALGVGPEIPVGICVERSLEMVVGLLGVLKAGGIHLPLDPSLPKERIAFMVSDAEAPVLLTQQRLASKLQPMERRTQVIHLDADWESLSEASDENPAGGAGPQNLCYLIYTSGSTGRPKGVGMSQRTLTNLIGWQNRLSPLAAGGRSLQFNSFGFDVSFLEILSTLTTSGTLVLIPEDTGRDFAALAALLAAERIERLFLPFTALRHLCASLEAEERLDLSLRQVISTGEALRITAPIARFFQQLAGCTLHNEYGPTETHFVSEHALPAGDPAQWLPLPAIGRSIPNAEIHLLDGELRPVPIGVSGELYAGGEALARGYLGRPQLTAERFVPSPFGDEPGARLYRTGDLARYLPDGNVEYLGRMDHQVKIRGFRIELGEIEVALAKHPRLREVVVAAREDEQRGDKRLVAYVVAKEEPPSVTELRLFLLEKLPEYMVPASFMVLDRLPLGATGKVDRRRLPEPDATRPNLERAYAAPRSPVEEELARIWASVLLVERVGVHDDFFELGGHSLLATLLIGRVREAFELELPLRLIFEFPTIAELAVAIVQSQVEQSDQGEIAKLLAELEGLSPGEVQDMLAESGPS